MTIKQLGGVFGRNPTFNDVTIEGELTFDGDIDINSDLKVDGDLEVTGTSKLTGNVGIGKSSGVQSLEVQGGALFGSGTDGIKLTYSGGNSTGIIDTGYTSTGLEFRVGNVKKLILNSSGNLEMNSGSGIDFSATAGTGTSELLDDYEEGTFTPEIADASSGGNTGSAALAEGYYTKVGRLVTIAISLIDIDTTGMTSGNNLYVRNLPFSQGAGVDHGSARVNAVTFSGSLSTYCTGTYALVADSVSGASFGYVTVGDCTSGSADIYMSFTYRV
jgi:hypothetical protein